MTDHKFTDEEIVLLVGAYTNRKCDNCKFADLGVTCGSCFIRVIKDSIALINRQKAEIERYEKTVGKLAVNKDGIVTGMLNGKETEYTQKSVADVFRNMAVNRAKAEAIKEFAERLKEKAYIPKPYGAAKVVDEYAVDDLVKEMTEG